MKQENKHEAVLPSYSSHKCLCVCGMHILPTVHVIAFILGMLTVHCPRCTAEFSGIWTRDTFNIIKHLINMRRGWCSVLSAQGQSWTCLLLSPWINFSNLVKSLQDQFDIWIFLFHHIGQTDRHCRVAGANLRYRINIHRITSSSAICLQSKSQLLFWNVVNLGFKIVSIAQQTSELADVQSMRVTTLQ